MGWDDDDWDDEDVEKKLETSQAKKAKDWDDSSDEGEKAKEEEKKPEPKAEPKVAAKAEAKPKATGKKGKKKFTPLNLAEETPKGGDVALADPVAEKQRRQKAVEDSDKRLAQDLFDDCPKPEPEKKTTKEPSKAAASSDAPPKVQYVTKDSFEELELKTQKDVETLSSRCCKKINDATTLKAGAAHKFVFDLFKAIEPELDAQQLNELDKFVASILKEKKVTKTAVEANKKKGNEKLSKTTKFNAQDEMSIVYGGGDWDEEDWDGYEDY